MKRSKANITNIHLVSMDANHSTKKLFHKRCTDQNMTCQSDKSCYVNKQNHYWNTPYFFITTVKKCSQDAKYDFGYFPDTYMYYTHTQTHTHGCKQSYIFPNEPYMIEEWVI